MSSPTSQAPCKRQAPGGSTTVVLGGDSTIWESSSIAVRGKSAASVAAGQISREPRMSPGGVDSVLLGGPVASPTVEELLVKPSPGGVDSITFGDVLPDLPVVSLVTRFPPGGVDSIDFAECNEAASAADLLSRPAPGGEDTVVLGGDDADWSTHSQALGVGSIEACAAMESRARHAPGGADSIVFAAEKKNSSVKELLARPSPGGSDSVNFSKCAEQSSADELLSRPPVGGSSTLVLGSDGSDWAQDSQTVGIGSAEAVALMQFTERTAPGGIDSVDFNSRPAALSKEELLTRPPVGGKTAVVLGGDKAAWSTDSSALGVGSVEAVTKAKPRSPIPPGGVDSVNGMSDMVASSTVAELLSRPATGGKTSLVLGGDAADWVTSSSSCKIPSGYVAESVPRQVPGGVDSIDFTAAPADLPTIESLLARSAVGGVDSVEFGKGDASALSSKDLLKRPCPGGKDKVVLGSSEGEWKTSGQVHSHEVFEHASMARVNSRLSPGGIDSVAMGGGDFNTPSVETLLLRPAVGGSVTMVLGQDDSTWSTCSDAIGAGCANAAAVARATTAQTAVAAVDSIDFANDYVHTPAKPIRIMNPTATVSNFSIEDHSFTPTPGVSSNRFARGSNQNSGNVLTDRPTTRLHQAPGGNSTLSLADLSASPAVGETKKRPKSLSNLQPPGGVSTIHFGDEKFQGKNAQDENINSSNLQQALQNTVKVTQAPGGNAAIVLG